MLCVLFILSDSHGSSDLFIGNRSFNLMWCVGGGGSLRCGIGYDIIVLSSGGRADITILSPRTFLTINDSASGQYDNHPKNWKIHPAWALLGITRHYWAYSLADPTLRS